MKKKLTLAIDEQVIQNAKDMNINISNVTERFLTVLTGRNTDEDLKYIVQAITDYERATQRLREVFKVTPLKVSV